MTPGAGPLPWQLDDWSRLGERADSDRLPHALLIGGPAGIGKEHLARALAARLLCSSPASGTACGNCKSCALLAAGSHPDLLDVSCEEGSRVIKIDQVRELIDFAGKTPAIAGNKVVLLGPAENMNLNAANALLKCLEEPTPSTTLLLYSHQPSALPATVRSRCQTVALAVPAREACLAWLRPQCADEATAEALLAAAGGRPLSALALLRSDGLELQQAVQAGLVSLARGQLSPLEFPALVSELDLEVVLALMQRVLEESLRVSTGPGDRRAQLGFQLRDELARLQRAIGNGANPNRQLIIEDCSTRLASALRDTTT